VSIFSSDADRFDTNRLQNAFGLHFPRRDRGVSPALEEIFARMGKGSSRK
jgi:hypothetical protein